MATVSQLMSDIAYAAGESTSAPSVAFGSGATISFVGRVTRMIEAELIKQHSPLLMYEGTINISSGVVYGSLPSDFWAVVSDTSVWVDGEPDKYLTAKPHQYVVQQQDTTASYFECFSISLLSGTTPTIHVGPTVNASSTLGILYYRKTDPPSTVSGTIPFGGLFDELYVTAVKMLADNATEAQVGFEERLTGAVENAVFIAAGMNDPQVSQVGDNWDWVEYED